MQEAIVRISEIQLRNLKNTQYGKIEMPAYAEKNYFSDKADLLGIYGQNGSGKTAVIEAMDIIQMLLAGKPLPDDTVHYISEESGNCSIAVKFLIRFPEKSILAEYAAELKRGTGLPIEISRETLSTAIWNGTRFENKRTLIDYSSSPDGPVFTPKYRFESLAKSGEDVRVNLSVAKKLAQKNTASFLFSQEIRSIFLSAPDEITQDYTPVIEALYQYASLNLFVISSAHSGSIATSSRLPFAFRLNLGNRIAKGDLMIRLDDPSVISKDQFQLVSQIIEEMNAVLSSLIPGLTIGIHNFGEQLRENGTPGYRIQLISKRGEVVIPLKYESEGIIKIISVLNVMMCVYNQPSMCMIIDELDSGIYEYLLGEILSVFEKGAKGQLIFTSHNLRALEMIHKRSIIFSTANPANRYIRLQNVKSNNNLRDLYLRSITLGGQPEEIYEETDSVEIGRAFRRAGKAVPYDKQD
ncbi:AAA family ATPase [Clostridium boliviensis]|uniref:AAA family ATPase n=1 Tax=Clostridium boliviensis TaxID=318465 RepID=A0ABU4GI73_9CLOT|nr:AAA family ATPase [Clostridium boliviensis]MDW2797312.1 AAA family ATPase [Clostridium boliviensis]